MDDMSRIGFGLLFRSPTSKRSSIFDIPRSRLSPSYTVFSLIWLFLCIHTSQSTDASSNSLLYSSTISDSSFQSCCSIGETAAATLDFLNPKGLPNILNETCASILQLQISAPEANADNETQSIFAERDWCQRVKYLCCLSKRRVQACRVGSNHVVQNGGRQCQEELFNHTVESQYMSVAQECCLCRTIWIGTRSDLLPWREFPSLGRKSPCGSFSCCRLLENDYFHIRTEPKRRSINQIEDDDLLFQQGTFPTPRSSSSFSTDSSSTTLFSTTKSSSPFETSHSSYSSATENYSSPSTFLTKPPTQTAKPFSDATPSNTYVELTALCADNYVWDADKELCVRLMTACPIGMVLNQTTNKCSKRPAGDSNIPCLTGYRYDLLIGACEDINECAEKLNCTGENMDCVNTLGGFNCSCVDGFSMADDGSCVDINECNYPKNPCQSGQQCRNIIGSYQCIRQVPCGFGYVLNPTTQECEDVNECKADPNICGAGMLCINVRGGHKCADKRCPGKSRRDKNGNCVPCPPGFLYNIDTSTCEDVDECSENKQCKSWEKCVNRLGYYICVDKIKCEYGTKINENGTACLDIDECMENTFTCSREEICVNTNGSYVCLPTPCSSTQMFNYETRTCGCTEGHRNIDDNCVDIDECAEGIQKCPVDQLCFNHVGGYRCIKLTECPTGFVRNSSFDPCQDVDECKSGAAQCAENMDCFNTLGSYQCLCKRGFKNIDEHTCVDVDECALFGSKTACPDPRARCVNTNGSHTCVCPNGLTWIDYPQSKCVDIDECAQDPMICGSEHHCFNLEGSYKCACVTGYRTAADQKSCVDIDECSHTQFMLDGHKRCSKSMCINTPGSYRCECPDGFRLGLGEQCYDIDECNEIAGVCKSKPSVIGYSQACVNLMGGYRCVANHCPPNYIKSPLGNGFRCELEERHNCIPGDVDCFIHRPQRIDSLFIELDQDTNVPQILARVDAKHLPSGSIRVDLRQHYANHLRTRDPITVNQAFRLQRSRTQPDNVEVVLIRRLPAPVDILISLHLTSTRREQQIGHSTTKLYLFITQTPEERIRLSVDTLRPKPSEDYWSKLRNDLKYRRTH